MDFMNVLEEYLKYSQQISILAYYTWLHKHLSVSIVKAMVLL